MMNADSTVSDGSWVDVPDDGARAAADDGAATMKNNAIDGVDDGAATEVEPEPDIKVANNDTTGPPPLDTVDEAAVENGEADAKTTDDEEMEGEPDADALVVEEAIVENDTNEQIVVDEPAPSSVHEDVVGKDEGGHNGKATSSVTHSGDTLTEQAPSINGNIEPEAGELKSTSDEQKTPPSSPAEQPPEEDPATITTDNGRGSFKSHVDPSKVSSTYLNVALESLESMRKLNLEVEFSSFPVCHEKCTYCQREALHKFRTNPPPLSQSTKDVSTNAEGGGGGGGINIGKVTLDGSRIRRFRSNMEEVKLDGSRLRRFGSNVGSFFSKPAVSANNEEDDDNSSRVTEATAKSCPPSLGNKSLSSMESIGGESITASSSASNNRAQSGRRNILKKKIHPCLTCGHPTCSKHSSSSFSKNHIPLCQPCAYLFELDFLVDVIASTASTPKECQQKVNEMVDCYDRAKLLLVYTAQYADEIADALETSTTRSNKIGAGSSATGIVSGLTGVVGCGALLFPPVAAAGVPLLIASLVFGGGATAVQSGDAAAKYFSEPNKLAEKMVALHGMVLSLLRITEVLSFGLLKSQLGVNYSLEGMSEEGKGGKDEETLQREALKKEINELLEKHGVSTTRAAVGGMQSAVTTGLIATEVAAASTRVIVTEAAAAGAVAGEAAIGASTVAQGASFVGRGSRYVGRVGTTAAASARFIPIAGGLISAACVYVEGKELKRTLERISEGNPCAMAEQVRSIRDELDMIPDSSLIADECRRLFEMAQAEKDKRAELVENDNDAKQGLQDVGDVSLNDVSQGDISDLIDVMETSAKVEMV